MKEDLQDLLSDLKEFEKSENLSQTKFSFNIYDTVPKRHYEDIHNSMLAYLLDPLEKHACKDLFLKKFLEEIKSKLSKEHQELITNMVIEKTNVYLEYPLSSNERVDVFITDGIRKIIIENKINGAKDQPEQLIRYKKACPGAVILYLSKKGHKPCKKTIQKKNNHVLKDCSDYYIISYRVQILNFLRSSYELLKENNFIDAQYGIKSYISLLETIILNSNSPIMKKTIKLLEQDYPEILKYINSDMLEELRSNLREKFILKLKKVLSAEWVFNEDVDLSQQDIEIAHNENLSDKVKKTRFIIGKSDNILFFGIKVDKLTMKKSDEIENKLRDKNIEVDNNGYWIDIQFNLIQESETYEFWDEKANYELAKNIDSNLTRFKKELDDFTIAYSKMRLN